MLPRRSRLPSSEFRAGRYRTERTPYFFLKMRPNGEKTNRIGVVITRAAHPKAARRNFWKRQAKAALARVKSDASDWLIIPSSRAAELTKREFRKKVLAAAAALGAKI